eukprot:10079295-Alexandrium_andersonii.AAC.1
MQRTPMQAATNPSAQLARATLAQADLSAIGRRAIVHSRCPCKLRCSQRRTKVPNQRCQWEMGW